MKRVYLPLTGLLLVAMGGEAQVSCVYCFEQNETISPEAVNLIANGSFENTTCTPGWFEDCYCPKSTKYNCDLANWTCTGGDELSYPSVFDTSLSIIPEGNNAAYLGNGNAFACSTEWGDLSCHSAEACVITGFPTGYPRSNPGYGEESGVSLLQTVSNLTIGQTYVLEFWAGGEPFHGLLTEPDFFSVDVGFGQIFLTCNPTALPDFPTGTRYVIVFTAQATSHEIKFTNWGHMCIDCTELVVDDVRLYTIEELNETVGECVTAAGPMIQDSEIAIYPNPFSDEITITTNSSFRTNVGLFDMLSRRICHEEFAGMTTLRTTMLADGIYFYKIGYHNGRLSTGILVKE